MEFSNRQIYKFGDVEVDIPRENLKCGDCERHLRKKAFSVLVCLLVNRDRLVTKEELMDDIWKDTAVTDDVLVQCIKEIRRAIGDDSHHPRFIKTIPKSGYRFIGKINEQNWQRRNQDKKLFSSGNNNPQSTINWANNTWQAPDNHFDVKEENQYPQNIFENRRIVSIVVSFVAIVFTFFGLLGQGLWQTNRKSIDLTLPHTAGKKTVAVMFFENQSKTPELDWLHEGLTDMLVTNLSRSSKLTVLSRQQLHLLIKRQSYKEGEAIGLDKSLEIGRKTHAESIIVGSFAGLGEKIRLDVQIFDTETGSLKATESLLADKPEHIFTGIDLLSLKLTRHLGTNETESHNQLADVMTDNLEAYRYYSLGIEKAQALHNKDALELLQKSITLDPQFAMAHARIGYVYAVSWGQANKGKPYLEKAFRLSDKLTEKDRFNINAWYAIANLDYLTAIQVFRENINKYPLENESYWRLARLLAGEECSEEAIEVLKQGLTVDSESKDIYKTLGGIYSTLGNHEKAIEARQRYVALAPAEPNAYDSLGMVYQWAGNYEAAIENYNRALELNPNFEIALIHLANTRFWMGQYNEAINLFRRYIQIAPSENERLRGFNSISTVYMEKQDLISAEKANYEALKISRENFWNTYLIALKKGNFGQAKKLEEQIFIASVFNNRGARLTRRYDYYSRGVMAMENGQSDFALENFKNAVLRSPPVWDIDVYEDCLAKAYLKSGKFEEARIEFERIIRLNPAYPKVYFYLAQAYSQQGQKNKAREFYQQFLQIWSNADEDIPEIIAAKKFINELN